MAVIRIAQDAADTTTRPWETVAVVLNGAPAQSRVAQRVALGRIADIRGIDVMILDQDEARDDIATVIFVDRHEPGRDPLAEQPRLSASRTTYCVLA